MKLNKENQKLSLQNSTDKQQKYNWKYTSQILFNKKTSFNIIKCIFDQHDKILANDFEIKKRSLKAINNVAYCHIIGDYHSINYLIFKKYALSTKIP